jgi:hypothetical protein
VAHRISSVRLGFHRNCGGADIRLGMAGEGIDSVGLLRLCRPVSNARPRPALLCEFAIVEAPAHR